MTQMDIDQLHHDALLLIDNKEYDEAVAICRFLLRDDPKNKETLILFAHIAILREDYKGALEYAKHLLKLIDEDRENIAVDMEYMVKLNDAGNKLYVKYCKLMSRAYLGLAKKYPDMSGYYKEKAKPYLDTILDDLMKINFLEESNDVFFFLWLEKFTDILQTYEKHNDALAYAMTAMEKYPHRAESYLVVANILMKQESHEEALALIRLAGQLEYKNPKVHKMLARYYEIVGEDDKAASEIETVRDLERSKRKAA